MRRRAFLGGSLAALARGCIEAGAGDRRSPSNILIENGFIATMDDEHRVYRFPRTSGTTSTTMRSPHGDSQIRLVPPHLDGASSPGIVVVVVAELEKFRLPKTCNGAGV